MTFFIIEMQRIQNSFHGFFRAALSRCSTQSSSQSQKKLDEIMVNADELITYKKLSIDHRGDIFHYWNAKKFKLPSTGFPRQSFLGATLEVRVKPRKNTWNFAKATANPADKLPEGREVFKYQASLKSITVWLPTKVYHLVYHQRNGTEIPKKRTIFENYDELVIMSLDRRTI